MKALVQAEDNLDFPANYTNYSCFFCALRPTCRQLNNLQGNISIDVQHEQTVDGTMSMQMQSLSSLDAWQASEGETNEAQEEPIQSSSIQSDNQEDEAG